MSWRAAVFAIALAFTGHAEAQLTYYGGGEAMFKLTQDIIARCNLTNVQFVGGGTSYGGSQMINGNQETAPMSRFLSGTECNAPGAGQGIRVGLAAAAVYRDDGEQSSCRVLRYAGTMTVQDLNNAAVVGCGNGAAGLDDGAGASVAETYTFGHWAEVLRIIYTGQHGSVPSTPAAGCGELAPSSTPISTAASRRCNSDVRRTLVENWGNIFASEGGAGTGGCREAQCVRLQHAFRRSEYSHTMDTFLSLIGAPSLLGNTVRPFCNGLENEDNDPIRRRAETATDPAVDPYSVASAVPFCKRNIPFGMDGSPSGPAGSVRPTAPAAGDVGDLGLVLPINMPSQTEHQYNIELCSTAPFGGTFAYAPMPPALSLNSQLCPDGNSRYGGQCRWPTSRERRFNCRAKRNNRPGSIAWQNFDARAYNLIPRNPSTGAILVPNIRGVQDPRWGGAGHYRVHQVLPASSQTAVPFTAARQPCTESTDTAQIGCLVKASPCSLAVSGLGSLSEGNRALTLATPVAGRGEVGPSDEHIARVLEPSGLRCEAGESARGARYPLVRALWFNSVKGFDSPNVLPVAFSNIVGADESALARCYTDRTIVEGAVGPDRDDPAISLLRRNELLPLPASLESRESRLSDLGQCTP